MEEKESTVSGSAGNSETASPPAPTNMALTMSSEGGLGLTATATATITPSSGGGVSGGGGGTQGSVDLSGRKKRGRPRKYDADGNLRLAAYTAGVTVTPPPPGFSLSPSPSEFSSKRGRGRPPGSGNWQLLASLGELFANTAGGDFTPHVVTVNTGEDVAGKILSFAQKGPRGICILSANGAVSNVTIRQPGSSGGILTYEGRFEILSLSGSFTVNDNGGVRSRTGGLSVSLAGPDGRVVGGGIAGLLTAASPIQIVVGSFMPNGYKVHKRKHHREHTVASPTSGVRETVTAARPISQAKPDGEPGGFTTTTPALPAQSQGEAENSTSTDKDNPVASASISSGWNGSDSKLEHGPSPDINISVPGE
ncbi:AT-hook motif nuclear-localized protein 7 [Ziziphus jujuba]|uniref:AT-hook motif nuclear-localized protein n=1 Tax=Ziziphus jujuba TaxID=326968 RepID=A0A6P4B8Q8_ZIZJJ|nr:AT-hook motif nuclear-localized protein 7 [Ziziphus jujuba]